MVVETLTFRLAAGVDEAEFLAADRAWQTELVPNRPGFVRRTTARGADGEWLVVTLWWSDADADAGRRAAESSPVGRRFLDLVEPGSAQRRLYTTLD